MGMIGVQCFPTTGWVEDYVTDLGTGESQMCQCCEKEWVRYVHAVHHKDGLWMSLEVGCICAGRLTGDPERSKQLDSAARNISARRANWCTLKGWKIGRKGGLILKKDGRIFAINRSKYGSWAGSWTGRGDEVWQRVDGWHRDLDAAKLALFDAVYGAPDVKEDEVAA